MSGLRWTRVRPGLYRSGEYTVGRLEPSGEWYCEGPGADGVLPSKRQAQTACQLAHYEYGKGATA